MIKPAMMAVVMLCAGCAKPTADDYYMADAELFAVKAEIAELQTRAGMPGVYDSLRTAYKQQRKLARKVVRLSPEGAR
jgi:hypothetical protein